MAATRTVMPISLAPSVTDLLLHDGEKRLDFSDGTLELDFAHEDPHELALALQAVSLIFAKASEMAERMRKDD